jgi:beta-glucosidase
MKGRTYRYYDGPVQYPFGYGLSYTSFGYSWSQKPKSSYLAKDTIRFTVSVNNLGPMDGDEVVQAYIEYPSSDRMPLKELKAFQRISVPKDHGQDLILSIPASDLRKWDLTTGKWKLYPGTYKIVLGSHSRDEKLTATFTVPDTPARRSGTRH